MTHTAKVCFFIKKTALLILLLAAHVHTRADEWRIVPGRATDIAVGANGKVWIVTNTPTGGGFTIQAWNGSSWETIDGGAVRIAVDPGGNPWVVNDAGQVFQRAANRWIRIDGTTASDIAIGANGSIWVVSTEAAPGGFAIKQLGTENVHGISRLNWYTALRGGGIKIAVAPNGQPFVVNNQHQVFERTNSGSWEKKPGEANDIGIGANGKIWVIGNNPVSRDFGIHEWMGVQWTQADGAAVTISVDNQGYPWVINSMQEIYHRVFTTPAYKAAPFTEKINMAYYNTGRISALAVDPADHNHIIAAGETGGLFETDNAGSAGRRWRPLSTFGQYRVSDILIVPLVTGGSEVWVTTMSSFENSDKPQIWKRSAAGLWSRAGFTAPGLTSLATSAAYRIIKDKRTNRLYACGKFGLAVKEETSSTWQLKTTEVPGLIISIESVENGNLVAASSNGLFYSVNGGTTWVRVSTVGFTAPIYTNPTVQRFIMKADDAGKVVFVSNMNAGLTQVMASTDNGITWNKAAVTVGRPYSGAGGFESVQPYFDQATGRLDLFISNRTNFFYGYSSGSSLAEAVNNILGSGFNWQPGNDFNGGFGFNALHEDTRQAFILTRGLAAPEMVITSDGGFSIADVNSSRKIETYTWTIDNTNTGLNALQVYNFTGAGNNFYFGTQDDGYGYNSNGLLNNWEAGGGREGYLVKKNGNGFSDEITMRGIDNRCGKVMNGWNPVTNCLLPGSTDLWNAPVANLSRPVNYCRDVYVQDSLSGSFGKSWRITYNQGCTWYTVAAASASRNADGGRAYFAAGANSAPAMVATFTRGGNVITGTLPNVLHQRSPARYWNLAAMGNMPQGIYMRRNEWLTVPLFSVNPVNEMQIAAVENGTGKLKMSNTGGALWTELSSFRDIYEESGKYALISDDGITAIWNLEFSPYDPSVMLVGTVDRGLFITKDSGRTWSRINSPGVFMPTDFHWKSATEVIVASYGAGLFRLSL